MTATPGLGNVDVAPGALHLLASTTEDTGVHIGQSFGNTLQSAEAACVSDLRGALSRALMEVSGNLNGELKVVIDTLGELAGKISDAEGRFGAHDDEAASILRSVGSSEGGLVQQILTGKGQG